MASSVQVQFSASIKDLVDATKQGTATLQEFKQQAERAFEGLKGFGEIVGISASLEGLREIASSMGELGEQTERMSAIFGISTEQVGRMSAIAESTGLSADTMALAMERLQVGLQKAQSGAGPVAAGLKAIGLSAKDLIGLPIETQMNRIADALSKFADGGNKTAIAMELFGRAGAQMIPTLDKGSKGLADAAAMADRTGTAMDRATTEGLANMKRGFVELGLSGKGLGITLVSEFEPAINGAVSSLTDFVEWLNKAVKTSPTLSFALGAIKAAADGLAIGLDAVVFAIEGVVQTVDLAFREIGDAITGNTGKAMDDIKSFNRSMEAEEKAFFARLKKIIADEGDVTAPSVKRPPPPPSDTTGDATRAAMEQYQAQIKLADEAFKQTAEKLQSELKLHQITNDEETRGLLDALEKRHAAEDAEIDGELLLYARGTAGYEKALNERRLLQQKYEADKQKIADQGLQADVKAWQQTLAPLQSAFDSQLKGLLAGTTTWAQAMKNVFADLVMAMIKKLEELAFEKLATSLANMFGDPAAMFASASRSIASSMGVMYAGEAAFFAPALGPAAPAAAAGVVGATQATALGMAALDVGAWEIPRMGAAMLHPGEMVLPAPAANAFRSMASGDVPGGGGGDVHFHGPFVQAIDTQTGYQFMLRHLPEFANQLRDHMNRNPSFN
jgi:hypothetical protein